jgi:DNA-binding CsgD family transcriptional regulator
VAVILHHWISESSETLRKEIRHHLVASFVSDMRGYRLLEIVGESYEAELSWSLTGGFRLRSDYADWYKEHADPRPQRRMIGITRDEGLATEGSVLSMLFHYTPPRFAFTATQRRLLAEAMQHKTDAEIACALHVSVSAVKKAWAAIFDRASDVLEPLVSTPTEPMQARSVRGVQKRHRLLTYLLDHPEEALTESTT